MKKLILSGACGRMGRNIAEIAEAYGFEIAAGVDPQGKAYADFPVYPSYGDITEEAQVLIDFSLPSALPLLAEYAARHHLPAVLCTTGYSQADEQQVLALSRQVPVFRSANMSMGVHVLKTLAAQAQKLLPGFDIEIVEKHHNQKVDAPSGTALQLLDALRGEDTFAQYGRTPESGKRKPEEIGLHAVRGGTVAGEHEVGFYGSNEVLTIAHSAQNRAIFAAGALRAAGFLLDKPSGFYTMDDYMAQLNQ